MKSSILALFAIVAIIAILMPDESSGLPARFRGRNQRFGRRGRGRTTFRRVGASFRGNNRRRHFGFQSRQGRTFPSQDVLPPQPVEPVEIALPQVDYDYQDDEEETVEVPHWCNPSHNMGPWMNFAKLRVWCADNGYSKFGPYGGVPSIDRSDVAGSGDEIDETNIDGDYEY